MKKSLKIAIVAAVLLLIFAYGVVLGSYQQIKIGVDRGNGQAADATVATMPATQAPQTQAPATQAPVTQTPAETQATQATQAPATDAPQNADTTAAPSAPASGDKAQVVAKVSEAVNKLKGEQNFKATKTEKTVINITECSASGLTNALNSICQKVAGEKVSTYDFKGGQAVGVDSEGKQLNDGNAVSPREVLPPKKADFVLNDAGVKEATAVKNGDSTTYTVKLISESSTVDKAPENNAAAVGFLNLGGFNIPTVTISQADIDYPETVITVTVDAQGRVTALKVDQPMEGSMGAKIAIVSGTAGFNGGNYESWEFAY